MAASILLAFLIPMIALTTANATHTTQATHSDHENHPNIGKGTITFTQTAIISGPTTLGHRTTIEVVKETLDFNGNLTGTALTIERRVTHNVTDEGVKVIFTTFQGWGNFTGTLAGNSVKLHIGYDGVQNSTFTRGNFVVSGDTNQNHEVLGEGHFSGALNVGEGGSAVNYSMHWTFQTHPEHVEARDKDT
jgi:hypothetical protein